MSRSSRTIYVGNLPGDIRTREVENLFYKFGPIVDIDLKIPPKPPGYAFVEFEDPCHANDAIRRRDGYKYDGYHLRVELALRGRDRHCSYYSSRSGQSGAFRHSDYRVLITGLPSSASRQDLKDHMRIAGEVCFSEVFGDRHCVSGIVEYTSYDDMKYAIRELDDSLFRNALGRAYIRVREYDSKRAYSRSPSCSPYYSRSRSPSYRSSYSSLISTSKSPPRKRYSQTDRKRYSPSVSPLRAASSRSRSESYHRSYTRSISRSPSPLYHDRRRDKDGGRSRR